MAQGWYTLPDGNIIYGIGNGKLAVGYKQIDGKYYYFNEEGYVQKYHQMIDGNPYYFFSNGTAMAQGWYTLPDGNIIYGIGNGKLAVGYKQIDGKYYYFNEEGYVQKYHQMIDGNPYYFFSNGTAMAQGWYTLPDGNIIYGIGNGKLAVGKLEIGYYDCEFDKYGILISKEIKMHNISGNSNITVNNLVDYYTKKGKIYPLYYKNTDAPDLQTFCQIYIEEAKIENIRADVAFCQAMLETGWLKFGGNVDISQFNFAGLGSTGAGVKGASFLNVRNGVRAQIQHLKAYANNENLNNACVDPRFNYVKRGSAPYVEWLGQNDNPNGYGWATASGYGYNILKLMNELNTL